MSAAVEAEDVMIVRVRLRGRWRGSGCRVSVGAIVAAVVSSYLIAVVWVL